MTWYMKKGSKYGAKKQEYNGRKYDSKKEAGKAQELDLLLKAGKIIEIQPQFRINLVVNGYKICTHLVDFYIKWANGDEELLEIKGFATEIWRLKRKLLEATYLKENPHIKYTVEY